MITEYTLRNSYKGTWENHLSNHFTVVDVDTSYKVLCLADSIRFTFDINNMPFFLLFHKLGI